MEDPLLSPDFIEALRYTAELHLRQFRKGTRIPYVAHVLSVAALVLEYGGTEDEAIAALLHDAVEDQGGRPVLDRIARRFGQAVADIVEGCTDAETFPKPPWRQRKEAYVSHIAAASESVCLVCAADKLHNARAILRDYRNLGDDLWTRFQGGRDGTLWYYREVVNALRNRFQHSIVEDLEREVSELEKLASTASA